MMCPPGDVGDSGASGLRGPPGDMGPMGIHGLKGIPGRSIPGQYLQPTSKAVSYNTRVTLRKHKTNMFTMC